jgi:hypothetical protein
VGPSVSLPICRCQQHHYSLPALCPVYRGPSQRREAGKHAALNMNAHFVDLPTQGAIDEEFGGKPRLGHYSATRHIISRQLGREKESNLECWRVACPTLSWGITRAPDWKQHRRRCPPKELGGVMIHLRKAGGRQLLLRMTIAAIALSPTDSALLVCQHVGRSSAIASAPSPSAAACAPLGLTEC